MLISKNVIRRLIRESINDFYKSDFIGLESGSTMVPQKVYSDIRNWFSNNQGIINKLRAFKKQGEELKYDDPKRQAFLTQADELTKGVTSDILPDGMTMRDIERVRAQYIAFIGKALLDNTPKLKEELRKIQAFGYYERQSHISQFNSIFEVLFGQVDKIGLGPVSYEDYKRAVESLGDQLPDYRYGGTRRINPLEDEIPEKAIPVVTGGLTPHEKAARERKPHTDRSYFITQQLRNRKNIQITNDLSLTTIFIEYLFDADEEMIGNYDASEITEQAHDALFDTIYAYNPDLAVLGYENIYPLTMDQRNKLTRLPSARGYNKREADELAAQMDGYGHKILLICTQDALNSFIDKIENINFIAEDVGQAMSGIEVEFRVLWGDTINHIEPNSFESTLDFVLDGYRGRNAQYGIPTSEKASAGEIISQHKEFLEIAKDYQHDHDYGGSKCKDPSLGEEINETIFTILQDMGHNYDI